VKSFNKPRTKLNNSKKNQKNSGFQFEIVFLGNQFTILRICKIKEQKSVATSVSKEESRVIERNNGAGLPMDVILLFEELHERVSDTLRRPLNFG